MMSLMMVLEDEDANVLDSCFVSLAKVMSCG